MGDFSDISAYLGNRIDTMAGFDVERVLSDLTNDEKVALLSGTSDLST